MKRILGSQRTICKCCICVCIQCCSFIYDAILNSAAPELLEEYWRNHGDDADTRRENKRKRVTTPEDEDARAMPPPPPRTPRTPRRTRQDDNQRQSLGRRTVKFNGHDVIVDDAYPKNADKIDWEKEVKAVELVGPQANGGLEAVIQW